MTDKTFFEKYPEFKNVLTVNEDDVNVWPEDNMMLDCDYGIYESDFIKVLDEHFVRKSSIHHINEDEVHELIIKGVCYTDSGLKIDATYPADFSALTKYLLSEHRLLEQFKDKVREAIEELRSKRCVNYSDGCSNLKYPDTKCLHCELYDELKEELGL